ncbi:MULTISPECIES: class I SAM-dependent methyltransferase [unclassified Fusibacter]|uniref:class I SAM-dependent methyltransferase n=1 Tax=unclassified Fusibacter TaxID=2624464 RepID=UPI001012B0BC|nr:MULTISPECIES: class I SAM-dependent methyltransferase [unclassified Fusibacter]MCK8061052.1 class I SAM-dependent methyltransferase [Fusibacter sp. A2]NPE20494.1 class I SAM-dependent methyltransferase [Fusibacter sp. A1]RXV63694.1 class I SAM-dependent methyltransferase [Fusibacter sp. A1]
MNLSNVSKTAIITMTCRSSQTENLKSDFNDPMSTQSLRRLTDLASESEKKTIHKIKKMYGKYSKKEAQSLVKRVSSIDRIINDYILNHQDCTVINIACGFDTRYWRLDRRDCTYIELDLPEVIDQKKELLGDQINYNMISTSVLNFDWIDEVTKEGNSNFVLVMEGLLMYFEEEDVKKLLGAISERFSNSLLVTDALDKKLTEGLYKKIGDWSSKLLLGFELGWNFGFEKAEDIETYGNYRLIGVEGKQPYVITASIK